MDSELEKLVATTRRLARTKGNRKAKRHRRGERLLQTIRQTGGLPEPRIVDPAPQPKPQDGDLFSDFVLFGRRVSTLVSTARERESRIYHCPPYEHEESRRSHTNRRRQANPAEASFGSDAPDRNAPRLLAAGVSLLAFFAVALVMIAAPKGQNERRMVEREAIPSPAPTVDAEFELKTLAGEVPIDDIE